MTVLPEGAQGRDQATRRKSAGNGILIRPPIIETMIAVARAGDHHREALSLPLERFEARTCHLKS